MRDLAVCCIVCKLMVAICGALEKGVCIECKENTHELDDQDTLDMADMHDVKVRIQTCIR